MTTSVNYKHSAFALKMLESIRCGKYIAGMRILSERDLSERFSVSRNTVREGLSRLFEMNILERRGRGAFVTDEALRIIESGIGDNVACLPKVWALLAFSSYQNPIYRTIFEIIRSGLTGRAVLETAFSDELPGAAAENIKSDDIVLLFGNHIDENKLAALAKKCPNILLINSEHELYNYILPDNYAAGHAVAKHLYNNGHRRIMAALVKPELPGEFHDRFAGAMDFLRSKNLQLITEDPTDLSNEYKIMQFFLEESLKKHATALICFKDIQALMIYEMARAKNLLLPRDLSIVGFDDRCYTANCSPALTTVRYPAEAIGGAALHTVLTFIDGKAPASHLRITPALLERESVYKLD